MKDIILKYLKGEASKDEKQQLLFWLRKSDANKTLFAETRDHWLDSDATPISDPEYIEQAFSRFLKEIQKEKQGGKRLQFTFMYKIVASVAILLAVSIGSYWFGKKQTSPSLPEKVLTFNRVIMGKDNKGSVILPDGTTVWLNANSQLIYPESFASDKRQVQLEGEGYFEVIHDENIPFYVETDGLTIQVLGTHFNVNSYTDSETIETTLLSGKVEVFLPGTEQRILLKPNQKITCNKQDGSYTLDDVDSSDYIIWVKDKLVCTNEKLSTILNRMEHWYHVDIVCEPGVSLNHRLSLTIRKESPEEILKLLAMITPIQYKIEKQKITISPK